MVMGEIEATRYHDGPFMLVEEDHYVTPSFYDAMMRLHHIKQKLVHLLLYYVLLTQIH